jgi:hypothetical protein
MTYWLVLIPVLLVVVGYGGLVYTFFEGAPEKRRGEGRE